MPRRRLWITAFAVSAVFCAWAAQPDYYPLNQGNQWVYGCTGFCGNVLPVVAISRKDQFNGKSYFLLEGFGGRPTWLRQDEGGVLWALDSATGGESRWYAFFTPEKGSFETTVDPCSPHATVAARAATYQGPAGTFHDALQIVYAGGSCNDAGLLEEWFLPGTGLVRRTVSTIAGPRTYDLTYARIGGVMVTSQPELQFSIALDRGVYTANLMPPIDPSVSVPVMTARLSLRNTTDKPVRLAFSSGQRYDLELKNARGDVVYRWSDERAFTMALGEEMIGPGERNYVVTVRLADKEGKPLAQGKYTAVGWITSTGPRVYSASVGFEIRHLY
jgi:hypothetical protein